MPRVWYDIDRSNSASTESFSFCPNNSKFEMAIHKMVLQNIPAHGFLLIVGCSWFSPECWLLRYTGKHLHSDDFCPVTTSCPGMWSNTVKADGISDKRI